MGFLTDLFGGKKDAKPVTTNTQQSSQTTTDVAGWQMPLFQQLIDAGVDVGSSEFQKYLGPIAAEFDPDTKAAWDTIRGLQGDYEPGIGAARESAIAGAAGFDPAEFGQYQSAMTGGVLDEIARRGTRNLTESVLPGIQDDFISAGQLGSTRQRDITAQTLERANESILGEQAKVMENAQKTAMDAYQTGRAQRQSGASVLANVEGTALDTGLKAAAGQSGVGAQQMQRDQALINDERTQFQAGEDYKYKVLGALSGAGSALPRVGTSSTESTGNTVQSGMQYESPGILSQLAGIGLGVGGLMMGGPAGGAAGAALGSAFNPMPLNASSLGIGSMFARGGRARLPGTGRERLGGIIAALARGGRVRGTAPVMRAVAGA